MKNWVGHSKLIPIDFVELFNRKVIINELESSLNNYNKPESSVVAEDETEALVVAEVVQEDGYTNTEIKKRDKIASANLDEDNLEEQEKNETEEPVAT